MARFNRVVTNRIQRLWAPYLPPWVMVNHVGRRSGREYRTPAFATVRDGRVVLAVLYGPESDWVRNVLAAGAASVTRLGRTHRISAPRLVATRGSAARPDDLGWLSRVADHVLVAELGAGPGGPP
jgi:deazaflavin-dependent oxidoreductase (nitroreductase family)